MSSFRKPSVEDTLTAIEGRVAALEKLGEHCSNPADREADILLRDFVKWIRLTARFGGYAMKIAPYIGVLAAGWMWGGDTIRAALAAVFGRP